MPLDFERPQIKMDSLNSNLTCQTDRNVKIDGAETYVVRNNICYHGGKMFHRKKFLKLGTEVFSLIIQNE